MHKAGTTEGLRPRRRKIGAVIALLAVLGALLAPGVVSAQDDSPVLPRWLQRFDVPQDMEILSVGANGRVTFEAPLARVYGEAGDGFAVLAGGDIMNVCRDTKPASIEGVLYRRNGQFVTTSKPGGVEVPTFVYIPNSAYSSSSIRCVEAGSETAHRSPRRLHRDWNCESRTGTRRRPL
ncbi:MAG: hypothetical protein ACI81L_001506 [Verrucomicrobiales bacterium]|jgi:hypothetical protein